MCEAADRGPGRDSAMDKVHGKNRRGRRKQVWIRRPAEESSSSDSNSDVPLMSVAEIRATYQREQAAANDDAALTPAPSDGAEESSSPNSSSDEESSSDSDSDDDYDPMA